MKYDIITSPDEKEFVKKVNDKIAEGWEPVGGVQVVTSQIEILDKGKRFRIAPGYFQAVNKH